MVDGTLDNRDDIDRGWTVELAIPFRSLGRCTPEPGEEWRGNLYRIDRFPPPMEFQAWSPTLRDPANFHVPAHFGTILFTRNDHPDQRTSRTTPKTLFNITSGMDVAIFAPKKPPHDEPIAQMAATLISTKPCLSTQGGDADGRDHHRERRALRLVLRKPEHDNRDHQEPAADPNHAAEYPHREPKDYIEKITSISGPPRASQAHASNSRL